MKTGSRNKPIFSVLLSSICCGACCSADRLYLYWANIELYWRVYRHHHLLRGILLQVVGKHYRVLWLAWFEVSKRVEQNVKMWIHSCDCTKKNGSLPPVVFSRRGKKTRTCQPHPLHRHSSISLFLCLFCHFIHNTRIHSPVPRRGTLNVSRDSEHTLCCKMHCFSPQFSLSCLCFV